jgi:predicted protein tyrosine phosphatase
MHTMNVLFICNQNKNRSKTAEELFRKKYSTKSAGLYAQKPLTKRQLQWANIVVVMEDEQRTELARRFPDMYLKKKILSLGIADTYQYGQPELKQVLKERMEGLF